MVHLVSYFSALGLVVVVIGAAVLVSLGCLWLVQRFAARLHFVEATQFGEIFSASTGVIVALIFAFVTMAVWQNYDKVGGVVLREAHTLHNIYRNLESYPPRISEPVRAIMRGYVTRVIDHEWKSAAEGKADAEATAMLHKIGALLTAYRVTNIGEIPLHAETLRLIAEHRSLTGDRLKGGEPCLEPPMWIALICGALILIAYSSFFVVPRFGHHVVMISVLGAALGLMFYLLLAYNYPLTGPAAVSSAPYQQLLTYWK